MVSWIWLHAITERPRNVQIQRAIYSENFKCQIARSACIQIFSIRPDISRKLKMFARCACEGVLAVVPLSVSMYEPLHFRISNKLLH